MTTLTLLLCALSFLCVILYIFQKRSPDDVIITVKECEQKKELIKQHMRVNSVLKHIVRCLSAVNEDFICIGKNTDKIYDKYRRMTPDIIRLSMDADFISFIESQDSALIVSRKIRNIVEEIIKISRCRYNNPKIAKYFNMSDREIVSSFIDNELLHDCCQLKKLKSLIDEKG